MTDQERFAQAVQRFSCPFCGAKKGQGCRRVDDTYTPELPPLVQPHQNRITLLDEAEAGLPGRGFQ